MRALITGGGGFLGGYLAEELKKRGFALTLLLRNKKQNPKLETLDAEFVYGDLQNTDALTAACKNQDVVFHTAGVISYNPLKNDLMYRTNVLGTKNIASAALKAGVKKFIYTSSTAAIGVNENPKTMMTEESPFNARPLHLSYFDTKFDAEQELLKFIPQGLNATIVNPGSLLGPGDTRRYEQSYPGLIYKFNPPVLFHGGINFVDIRDATLGHILALEKGRPGERYILGGENLSFADLIRRTNKIIGRKSPKLFLPRSFMGAAALGIRLLEKCGVQMHITPELVKQVSNWYLYVDSAKATRELGYSSRPVDESISLTLEWLKKLGRI